jgi:hypothetical protein
VDGAHVGDAEPVRICDGQEGRVVELTREDADAEPFGNAAFGVAHGRDRRDVGDDDARLEEQTQLEPELTALRGREQRALAELLGQDDGHDDVVASTAQALDLAEHGRHGIGPGGPDVEPRPAARVVEPAHLNTRVAAGHRHVQRVEAALADQARVPDGPLGGDVERLGVDENAVLHDNGPGPR